MNAVSEAVNTALNESIKLDIGCGKNKQAGFLGIDIYDFTGVDFVADLRLKGKWLLSKAPEEMHPRLDQYNLTTWTFQDNSVDEARASHFLEHLTNLHGAWERVNFFNELYRILKPGAQCQLIFPHWASSRYYGDPTHKEPFSEWGFFYLNKQWRLDQGNAPHADASVNPAGYSCDFDWTYGYSLHQLLQNRSPDVQQFALTWGKEAAQDIFATITKKAS